MKPHLRTLAFRAAVLTALALSVLRAGTAVAQVDAQAPAAAVAVQPLPTSLSDAEWWRLTTTMSEQGGVFQSDNWTSNEIEVSWLANMLRTNGHVGGAYLGVGPEQNFTYIAAIKPQIVFLFDIRRQAILHQMMYKAIFELSPTRADFISLLFNKPRPAGLDTSSTIMDIWNRYWLVDTDTSTYQANLARIKDQLTKTHGFALDSLDLSTIELVYHTFYWLGPSITYGGTTGGGGNSANFATLTQSLDGPNSASGQPGSFLGTEANYRVVREMHQKNLIVPVVGDFAGPKAIRAVGNYLREHGTNVTGFYVSNVEQYLFQNGVARNFYDNVATLPQDSMTVFIRPYALRRGPAAAGMCPISAYIRAVNMGIVYSFDDANACRQG